MLDPTAYWKRQAEHFTQRCAEQGDSIAAYRGLLEAQRREIKRLQQCLAESEQAAYDIAGTIDFLKTENARLTQRVEELEEEF